MLNKLWLCIAGVAVVPLVASAAATIPTTIAQSVAPVSIDRCTALLAKGAGGYELSEYVDFTNVGQLSATEVRFAFEIVDAIGRTERTLTAHQVGRFAPGVPVTQPTSSPADSNHMSQTVSALPSSAKITCSVRMVRLDDGSVWQMGDGPVGSGVIFTPPPEPPPTPSWHFPDDQPTP